MKVLIGTKNPGKIKGAKMAFDNYFDGYEIEGVNVPSEVSDQPINDDTYLGAYNRVKNAKEYARQMNIKGLLSNVKVILIKITDQNGNSTFKDLLKGLEIAEKYNATVINISLGTDISNDEVTKK